MKYIAKTSGYGERLDKNATKLAQALDAEATSAYFTSTGDDFPFALNAYVVIGEEKLKITAVGDTPGNPATVTRAQGGTSDVEHIAGETVLLFGGTDILSHTWDGDDYANIIKVSANVEIEWCLVVNDTEYPHQVTSPQKLSDFEPFGSYQPTNNQVWKIRVWTMKDKLTRAWGGFVEGQA